MFNILRKQKGGTQKWNLINPVFKKMVKKKSILDIGAHRGLYCIKALEYGSKKATAFDTNEYHIANLMKVKEKFSLEDLLVYHGDFFRNNDNELYKKNMTQFFCLVSFIICFA